MAKKIMIVSGEPSGDIHGAHLISELKKIDKDISIGGMGGVKMLEAGLEGIDSTSIAVMGFVEVVKRYPAIKKIFNELLSKLDKEKFDAVVLIDYPGFNLRLAKEVKKRGIPVIYYISPQVWAWKKGRVKQIARDVTKMLVAFPFEEEFYKGTGVDAEFVGHPLLDHGNYSYDKNEVRAEFGFKPDDKVIAVLPGSRADEVKTLLPAMLGGVRELNKKEGLSYKVILPKATSVDKFVFQKAISVAGDGLDIKVVDNVNDNMIKALCSADASVVASGTASLETALTGTPLVIVYKVAFFTYCILRFFAGSQNIGLPNIVAGKNIVPELIQYDVTEEKIAKELSLIVGSDEVKNKMIDDLKSLKANLGSLGAAKKVANAVYKIIS